MIKVINSNEHFHHEEDWLSTYWHFSFDSYRDKDNMNFGALRVFNDDVIKPGKGFGFHPHRDMEIITYVIDGELEHRDDQGNHGVIHAGEVQSMTAGSGIVHSEYNHSKDKPLRLLQMWIFPDRQGLEPSWEQQKFERKERADRLFPIVVEKKSINGRAVHINQDATVYVSSLNTGKSVEHRIAAGRKVYLFVIEGKVKVGGNVLDAGDSARIENELVVAIEAKEQSELILLDLPEIDDVDG